MNRYVEFFSPIIFKGKILIFEKAWCNGVSQRLLRLTVSGLKSVTENTSLYDFVVPFDGNLVLACSEYWAFKSSQFVFREAMAIDSFGARCLLLVKLRSLDHRRGPSFTIVSDLHRGFREMLIYSRLMNCSLHMNLLVSVGWLKPWMMPEILAVSVPEKIMNGIETVPGNSQKFIETFNKEHKHVSKIDKSISMEDVVTT